MPSAMLTAASGLLSHQRKLDVVANNLANLNTVGYKTSRVVFADLMYETLQSSSASRNPDFGGTNPLQVGTGVRVAQISKLFTQGNLESTGALFDFAIQGDGFFQLSDSTNQWYTRAGAFTLDSNANLVDPSTGLLVQRTGTYGETTETLTGFQTPGDKSINIPLGTAIAGEKTTFANFAGNLPASALPPQAESLITAGRFELADGSPAIGATLLNDLKSNNIDYVAGDAVDISGTNPDGSSFSTTLSVGPTATLDDLVNSLNGVLVGATASLDPSGNMQVTADTEGEAFLSVFMQDAASNTGQTDLSDHSFFVETEGKFGDTFETSIEVFDSRGADHRLKVTFTKQSWNVWDADVGAQFKRRQCR